MVIVVMYFSATLFSCIQTFQNNLHCMLELSFILSLSSAISNPNRSKMWMTLEPLLHQTDLKKHRDTFHVQQTINHEIVWSTIDCWNKLCHILHPSRVLLCTPTVYCYSRHSAGLQKLCVVTAQCHAGTGVKGAKSAVHMKYIIWKVKSGNAGILGQS